MKATDYNIRVSRDGVEFRAICTCAGCGRTLGLKGSDLPEDRKPDGWARHGVKGLLRSAQWSTDGGGTCQECLVSAA